MARRSRLLPMAMLVVLLASPLTSCASAPPALDRLPDGVTVGVQQNRSDQAPRRLQIVIGNGSDAELVVTGARLDSGWFAASASTEDRRVRIPAGRTVGLPVALPDSDCTGKPGATVLVEFETADGDGRVAVEPEDRFDRLPALHAEDCLAESVAATVELSLAAEPVVASVGGAEVATLRLSVRPTGEGGPVTIVSVAGTTLLSPADPVTGARLDTAPLDVTVRPGDAATHIDLALVPARCDAHAIAEDKVGTLLPLEVSAADGGGRVTVAASPSVRGALYAFVQHACGVG